MEMEGVRFRAPTTTEIEHNADCPDCPKSVITVRHLIVCHCGRAATTREKLEGQVQKR